MAQHDDPRLAKAVAMPIDKVASDLGIHWMLRGYPERAGYCPKCGGADKKGSDRFSLNLLKNTFYCRKCDKGGDTVALVRFYRECGFLDALEWLCGARPEKPETEAERKARLAKEEAAAAKRDRDAAEHRRAAIRSAHDLWGQGLPPAGTAVEGYLALRSIDIAALGGFPRSIRFHAGLPYTHFIDGAWREVHRGPAMLAAMQGPDGKFCGLHRTWLDLSRPKGKALVLHPETGEALDVKKGLGSKKGAAIRLTDRAAGPVMICAEGLETTWSAMMAGVHVDAAFWCLIDMGNMAGRRQAGPGLKFAGLPDLGDADAFVPPPWVKRLIFVMDGDSDPKMTRAQMEAGLRRAMARDPELRGQIVVAPSGFDLNDVLMGGA